MALLDNRFGSERNHCALTIILCLVYVNSHSLLVIHRWGKTALARDTRTLYIGYMEDDLKTEVPDINMENALEVLNHNEQEREDLYED